MKFSVRQILASAAGAVLAALIASSFGVTGTIIGVAIGSVVATMGTALVGQSIERGHEAVKSVVVRAPDSTLLRRFGGTEASGQREGTVRTGPLPVEPSTATSGSEAADDRTATMESTVAAGDTRRLEVSAVAGAPATERFEAGTFPPAAGWPSRITGPFGRRYSWQTFAGAAGIVFLLALSFVTAVELSSGKPLSSLFGDHDSGPSVKDIFVPSPTPAPVPTTTTTTSTTVPASTTSTTGPGASSTTTLSTTTTAPSGESTTTSGGSTTTTSPGAITTTSIPR